MSSATRMQALIAVLENRFDLEQGAPPWARAQVAVIRALAEEIAHGPTGGDGLRGQLHDELRRLDVRLREELRRSRRADAKMTEEGRTP